jgi:hypothetical protein
MPTIVDTELLFRQYGSALESKEAARTSLNLFKIALDHGEFLDQTLRVELESVISHVSNFFTIASNTVSHLKPK